MGTGYSLAGERKFHRYGDEPVAGVQPLGSKVLVMTPRRTTLIDVRTGRELRRYRRLRSGTPVVGDRSFLLDWANRDVGALAETAEPARA